MVPSYRNEVAKILLKLIRWTKCLTLPTKIDDYCWDAIYIWKEDSSSDMYHAALLQIVAILCRHSCMSVRLCHSSFHPMVAFCLPRHSTSLILISTSLSQMYFFCFFYVTHLCFCWCMTITDACIIALRVHTYM